MKQKSLSIKDLSSSVVDNGRRGMPKPGCDCEQCFGYCLVDQDEAMRKSWLAQKVQTVQTEGAPLDLEVV